MGRGDVVRSRAELGRGPTFKDDALPATLAPIPSLSLDKVGGGGGAPRRSPPVFQPGRRSGAVPRRARCGRLSLRARAGRFACAGMRVAAWPAPAAPPRRRAADGGGQPRQLPRSSRDRDRGRGRGLGRGRNGPGRPSPPSVVTRRNEARSAPSSAARARRDLGASSL